MVGEVAKQPCPGGASGLARWKCVGNEQNNNLPTWFPESPDLSDCKSAWLLSLQVCRIFLERVSTGIIYYIKYMTLSPEFLIGYIEEEKIIVRIIIHMFVITMSTGKSVGGRQNIQRCE